MEENLTTEKSGKSLELFPEGVAYLNEARRWTMFLSVLGFIGIGFCIILALFMGTIFSLIPDTDLPAGFGVIMGLVYLVIGGLYFFPVYYLFQFSQKSKKAVESHDSTLFTEAIGKLKSHYRFIGIMTIAMFVLYPVIILVAVIVGVATGF